MMRCGIQDPATILQSRYPQAVPTVADRTLVASGLFLIVIVQTLDHQAPVDADSAALSVSSLSSLHSHGSCWVSRCDLNTEFHLLGRC